MSREIWIGVVSTIAAVLVVIVSPLGNPPQLRTLPFVLLIALALAALVFVLIVPWARRGSPQTNRSAKAGLVCSILGLLTVVAYWSGFPIILGAGGATLGRVGQGGLARAAYIIGIVAVVLALIAFAADRIGCILGGPC